MVKFNIGDYFEFEAIINGEKKILKGNYKTEPLKSEEREERKNFKQFYTETDTARDLAEETENDYIRIQILKEKDANSYIKKLLSEKREDFTRKDLERSIEHSPAIVERIENANNNKNKIRQINKKIRNSDIPEKLAQYKIEKYLQSEDLKDILLICELYSYEDVLASIHEAVKEKKQKDHESL